MRRSNSLTQAPSSSSGTNVTEKAQRRQRHIRKKSSRRRRRSHVGYLLLLLVSVFVVAWLWLVMTMVSWISTDKPVNNDGDNLLRRRRNKMDNHHQQQLNDETANDDNDDHARPDKNKTAGFQRYTDMAPSCSSIEASDVDFTLVTQLSNDRLWMMKHHCDRWGHNHRISLAVLTNRTHNQVLEELVYQLGCDETQLTLQVLSADLYPPDDYPVNVLRNMALSKVTTTHVMYADIDFWESQDLFDLLHLPQIRQHLAASHKHALVVPAFQLNRQCREWRECPEKNIPKMPRTRRELLKLIKDKQGYPFDPTNRGGHGSTMYMSWIKKQKEPGSLLPIPCVNSNRYEPYLAFRYCRDLPPFQEAFSGYGKNKMTMMMHMIRSGYRFDQLGGAYLVHYPHLDSKSRMEWNESPQAVQPKKVNGKWYKNKPDSVENVDWTTYKRGRVDATFVEFRKWLAREVPDESIIYKCSDAEDDDSKLWYDRSQQ